MKITNTIITRHANGETSNGKYQLEYSITNGTLNRVFANISRLPTDENPNETYIGNISYDNGMMNCSLPAEVKTTSYFEDFEGFMVIIKADVQALFPTKK